eukprot:TRINITY_DN4842_c0_g1_i2.p1 TRINITY_DN4842_c0_g1~~TRINITY_DN4842_c0_g1_i2.p1  ORF type:complete len:137 (+),score=30.14 TRINITY_DN4842_c0_g1_i2:102-512(+)
MFRSKEIDSVLARVCGDGSDGMQNILIVNEDGGVICSAKKNDEDRTSSAVLATIFAEYTLCDPRGNQNSLESMLMEFKSARVSITYLIPHEEVSLLLIALGDLTTPFGMLQHRTELLKGELEFMSELFVPGAEGGA